MFFDGISGRKLKALQNKTGRGCDLSVLFAVLFPLLVLVPFENEHEESAGHEGFREGSSADELNPNPGGREAVEVGEAERSAPISATPK